MTRNPKDPHKKRPAGKEENLPERTETDAGDGAESGERTPEYTQKLSPYRQFDSEVEAFVPTDFYPSSGGRGKKRRHSRKKRRALYAALIVLGVLLLCVGGVFAYAMLLDPGALFAEAQKTPGVAEVQTINADETSPSPGVEPTPTPTVDPYEIISAQADTSMMEQNIVNVLFIGVDYAEERETWSGKHEYHSDVMMVAAINFDENRVDLISLPRDTYAEIPGVKGIYKLNASINCGGGFEAEGGAGFLKTCEAASWMLGGIPVNYYYAVTMPAVKELVNAVGGVDYNLELDFKMAGRQYNAGPQHMNGQAVLDYLRVRKYVDKGGDLNRVNRQKEMLVALFKSMQKQNLILKIPDIISSFDGQLFTNCTFNQTAALTKFAYNLNSDDIGMYSIGGTITNIFNWNFCLTDQSNRVKVIKEVYNQDVPKELEYTADYAQYRWADIIATQYLDTVSRLTDTVSEALAADDLLPTMEPTPEITPELLPTDIPTEAPTESPVETPNPDDSTVYTGDSFTGIVRLSATQPNSSVRSEEYQQYSVYQREMFNNYLMSLDELEEAQAIARKEASKYAAGKSNDLKTATQDLKDYASHVKTNALALAAEFGYPTSKFVWTYWYDKDPDFNEVKVDFR
ncbi:Transcriptional regulator LytR [bioreactor metagenome]|uniref:Transcriptional regulator LytR n=1 Tax=bioreactor metagenome TaxID=1076179 RepID=A0A644YX96_9ZZZZ